MSETVDTDPAAPDTTDDATASEVFVPAAVEAAPSSNQRWAAGIGIMAILVVGGLLATQLFMINSINETRDDIAALEEQVGQVDDSVSDLATEVADVAATADELIQTAAAPSVDSGGSSPLNTPNAAAPAGFLPRYDSEAPGDQAIGMTLGTVEGIDAYTQEIVAVDPTDGTKRVWMVWAHWCPYCQEELPELSAWYPGVDDRYATELVTVSTSISPERGNPLEAYLEAEQFPFPVVVDPESAIAVQMGVSAFPFWLVTDGDGEVLLRATGLLHVEQVESLFDQLENLDA